MKRTAATTTTQSLRLLAAAALLPLSLFAGNASALNIAGSAAKAVSPADDTCASYSYGLLTNTCSTAKGFILPLSFNSEGYKNVSFIAYGATSSSDVSCKASAWNSTYTGLSTTATVSLPAFGSVQTVSLGTVYVWNPGGAYLYCTINPGGKLYMVSWDQ